MVFQFVSYFNGNGTVFHWLENQKHQSSSSTTEDAIPYRERGQHLKMRAENFLMNLTFHFNIDLRQRAKAIKTSQLQFHRRADRPFKVSICSIRFGWIKFFPLKPLLHMVTTVNKMCKQSHRKVPTNHTMPTARNHSFFCDLLVKTHALPNKNEWLLSATIAVFIRSTIIKACIERVHNIYKTVQVILSLH